MVNIGTFTINQNLVEQNLYIYPNGDLSTCTEFTAVGDNPNWKCVDDDRLTPDEDVTYVWWNSTPTATDLYEMQNHTTETGIINYVQVYARTKAHNIAQKIDGIFKIVCSPDSICSHVYESSDMDLVTNYTTYSKVWKLNPRDDAAFEWADIDAFCAGVKCSSPTITGASHSITLRPNAPGDKAECAVFGDAPNWKCVDEVVADDDTTYTWTDHSDPDETDLHHIEDSGIAAGVITKVTVVAKFKGSASAGIQLKVKTHGVEYFFGAGSLGAGWRYTSWSSTINPNTGVAWTIAEIDALQIGYELWTTAASTVKCTQIYAIVDYNDSISPEIRTTQVYAKVNYTIDTLECKLTRPIQISTDHSRNTKMLNFWNGTREVYDLNRSGKSMVLTGTEVYDGACDRIICMRSMARNGNIITISELAPTYFNGDYRIRQFGWNEISKKPQHIKWILSLEDAD